MCMANYLCSNNPLKQVPWKDDDPCFAIMESDDDHRIIERLKEMTGRRFIYEFTSYQGCGCGFFCAPDYARSSPENAAEAERNLRDLELLIGYLKEMRTVDHDLEIYTCERGEEYKGIKREAVLSIDSINPYRFEFDDNCLYHLK